MHNKVKIKLGNNEYYKCVLSELSFGEHIVLYGYNLFTKQPLYRFLYENYGMTEEDDNIGKDWGYMYTVFASLPNDDYRRFIEQYNDGREYGYNDSGCFPAENGEVEFYIIYDYVTIPREIADKIVEEFFTNYYWYMQSLPHKHMDKSTLVTKSYTMQGEKKVEHVENWYDKFVETFEKYYPKRKKEVDRREKLDLSELIEAYEALGK